MDENEGFFPSVYEGQNPNVRGVSLDTGDLLILKEQKGIYREDRVKENSHKTKRRVPKIEFINTWNRIETDTDANKLGIFEISTKLVHFNQLNMRMLAGAWILWINAGRPKELTPEIIRNQTVRESGRGVTETNFTRNLRNAIFNTNEEKGETKSVNDLSLKNIQWDLIRYITILINFNPER